VIHLSTSYCYLDISTSNLYKNNKQEKYKKKNKLTLKKIANSPLSDIEHKNIPVGVCFHAQGGHRHSGGKASSTKTHHSRACSSFRGGGSNFLHKKHAIRISRCGFVLVGVMAEARLRAPIRKGVLSCLKWRSRRRQPFEHKKHAI